MRGPDLKLKPASQLLQILLLVLVVVKTPEVKKIGREVSKITSAGIILLAQCLRLSSQLNITNNGAHGVHICLRSDAALHSRVTGFIKGTLTS